MASKTTTALPLAVRFQLDTARRTLGCSQADLADSAGISQGCVSNCLQGRVVRAGSLRRFLDGFESAAATAAHGRGLTPEQVAIVRKAIDAARRAIDCGPPSNSYFARPGGPMPENAANRIERRCNQVLLRALDDAPFTAAVVGPPECGKSTLLQLLASDARQRGFSVVDFDARIILSADDEWAKREDEGQDLDAGDELNARFFSELAYEIGTTLGISPDAEIRTRLDLARYLKATRLRRPSPPLVIVVDHASEIPLAFEELAQVCRSLDVQKSRTQMSWAFEAVDTPGGHRLAVLSRLTPAPLIEVPWFDRHELSRFAEPYDLNEAMHIDQLWTWFHGQPLLSHTAVDRFRDIGRQGDGNPLKAWEKLIFEVENLEQGFAHHITRIRLRLQKHSRWSQIRLESDSLDGFMKACTTSPELRDLAKQYGILRPGTREAVVSDQDIIHFYRLHLFKE